MFSIAKLQKVNNETVNIKLHTQTKNSYKNGSETFKTLSFDIDSDDYSFSFSLNCKLQNLLKIPMSETIDFNDYILEGETFLTPKGLKYYEPKIDAKIIRYLKIKFIIFLTFYTDYDSDENNYSGIIEITFNLDDYLKEDI